MKQKKFQCRNHPDFETNSKKEFIMHVKSNQEIL